MKSKTKTYTLLVLVLCIWGVIGYRIFSTINPKPSDIVQQDFNVLFNPKPSTEIDTFSIQTVNRDPFLGTMLIKKKLVKKSTIKYIKKEIVWIPIVYHGNISKQNSKEKVFIVSINGQQYLMKIGQIVADVKLIRGTNSHIIISYKGNRKTFLKS